MIELVTLGAQWLVQWFVLVLIACAAITYVVNRMNITYGQRALIGLVAGGVAGNLATLLLAVIHQ